MASGEPGSIEACAGLPQESSNGNWRIKGFTLFQARRLRRDRCRVDDLIPRLREDPLLRRFWTSPRSVDTNNRERQLTVDFIAAARAARPFTSAAT
jgi:hypothetical protein